MGGWIKIEKDLVTDPRFRRMARQLAAQLSCVTDVTQQRINPERAETLLLGGLARLWIYADTHIREDDTLDVGPDEIDEFIGIPGFVALMPADWLQVVDEDRVKLPEFHAHNGTDAKRKALTAKRVANHRIRNVTQGRNEGEAGCNALTLPDQTRPRPDQTKTQSAPATALDESRRPAEEAFRRFLAAYPPGSYRNSVWLLAERAFYQLTETVLADDLVAAAADYAAQQRAAGAIGTRFVLSPQNFLANGNWRGPFPITIQEAPEARKAREGREARADADRRAWERARALSSANGCPLEVREHESPEVYETRVRTWIANRPRAGSGPKPVAALVASGSNGRPGGEGGTVTVAVGPGGQAFGSAGGAP